MEKENNLKKFKYIVYETTNLVNSKIYVGVHQTIDPNVFDHYYGCGCISTQPCTYNHPKTAFQYAFKKYGPKNFVRKTLAVFNTPEEAFQLEEDIVNEEFLKREDVYNMILGGIAGCFLSERIQVFRYSETGEYLDSYPSFALAALEFGCDYTAISYAVRKKAKSCGCFWSTDKLEKLDLSLYNLGENHAKKIYCFNLDGTFRAEFKTQELAARTLNVWSTGIRKSCLLGIPIKEFYFSYIPGNSFSEARTEWVRTRKVYKYDSHGNFLEEYPTQEIAEFENKYCNISKAIRQKTPDINGNFWSLEKLKSYNQPKVNAKKPVGKFSLDGELVKRYDSATAAANENGTSVWKVLAGTNQTHKQYIYRYLTS